MSKRTLNMSLALRCFHTEKITFYFDFMALLIQRKIRNCNENYIND